MTNIQETINRLRELDQKASPAPWVFTGTKRTGYDTMEPGDLLEGNGLGLIPEIERVCPPVDAELIAEARNAIPALLTEIERLTIENQALTDELAKATGAPVTAHKTTTHDGVRWGQAYSSTWCENCHWTHTTPNKQEAAQAAENHEKDNR